MKCFKCALLTIALFFSCCLSAVVGTKIPIELIPQAIIQGTAITTWEKDKLYLFECWATWCGPCKTAMRHVEDLWQVMKVDGNRVIGLNVMDRLSIEDLQKFLAEQSTKVTYTNLLVRDDALTKLLKIQGIPFAFVVRNGIVVWQGHPMRLDVAMLEQLNKGESVATPPPKPVLKRPNTAIPTYAKLERRADEALVFNRWEEAEELQLQAMRAHPLHARLSTPYTPSEWILKEEGPETRGLSFQGVDVTNLSSEGDLAPYAMLLGQPLPKLDNEFTVISYWQPNVMLSQYTSQNAIQLPGMKEQQRLLYPYRLKVIGDVAFKEIATQQFSSIPSESPNIEFFANINKMQLFGYTDQNSPPFVAIFLSGKLIYKGALELLPETLSRYGKQSNLGPMPSAEVWLQRIADEKAHEKELQQRFLTFREEKNHEKATAMIESICADSKLGTWEMLLMPYRFGSFYNMNDVDGAVKLVERLYHHYYDSEHALEMLNTLIRSWPPLQEKVLGTHSLIAERLAQIQTQGNENYAMAYYELAGVLAKENNDSKRAEAMWIKALETSTTGKRYRMIRLRRKPIPAP